MSDQCAVPQFFTDADFVGAASVFDAIWGWELEEADDDERGALALLYTAGAVAGANWVRVIRSEAEGEVLALLCAAIKPEAPPETAASQHDGSRYAALALHYREALSQSAAGRRILDFYAQIDAVNAKLLGELKAKNLGWDAELKLLITSPAARGKGYASRLVEDCLHEVVARGGRWCMLLTDTHCAWQYYEKTGWHQDARCRWEDESGIIGFAYRKDAASF